MFVNKKMDKQIVMYSYSRKKFSNKKDQTIQLLSYTPRQANLRNMLSERKSILYDSIYIKF